MELQVMLNDLLMIVDTIMKAERIEVEVLMKMALEDDEGKDILGKKMFEEIDSNSNGFIEWQELVDYMVGLSRLTGKPPPTPESLKAIFVEADQNNDKKLSYEEIRSVLHGLVETTMALKKQK
jgi:Ca2+-binding EF-hand superfamily protein